MNEWESKANDRVGSASSFFVTPSAIWCLFTQHYHLTPVTELVGTRWMKRRECFQIMKQMIDLRKLGNVDDRSIGILIMQFFGNINSWATYNTVLMHMHCFLFI